LYGAIFHQTSPILHTAFSVPHSSIASRQSEQVNFHRKNYLKIWSC